jgi:hypothetical protein
MTSPTKLFLRRLLFMPDGDPVQQEKDVAAVERELQSGKERVRAARMSIEQAQHLRETYRQLLERT